LNPELSILVEEVLCICHNGAHKEHSERRKGPPFTRKVVSEIDETDDKGKLVRLAFNRNKLEMASFSIPFTTEKAMNII
jgi:hypothetical protein